MKHNNIKKAMAFALLTAVGIEQVLGSVSPVLAAEEPIATEEPESEIPDTAHAISITDFGANGTDAADDTAAFQAALDAITAPAIPTTKETTSKEAEATTEGTPSDATKEAPLDTTKEAPLDATEEALPEEVTSELPIQEAAEPAKTSAASSYTMVTVPDGTYYLSSPLELPSGVVLNASEHAELVFTGGAETFATGVDGAPLHDIYFYGGSWTTADGASSKAFFNRSNNITLDKLTIKDAVGEGINFNNCTNSKITNCTITGTTGDGKDTGSAIIVQGEFTNNISIIGNTLTNNARYGLQITAPNVTMKNNEIGNNAKKCLDVKNEDGACIGNPTGIAIALTASNCTIQNNNIHHNYGFGIVSYCPSLTVLGNNIYNNAWHGFVADGGKATNQVIQSNSIYENGRNGISVRNGATAKISKNKLDKNKESGIVVELGAFGDVYDNVITNTSFNGSVGGEGICISGSVSTTVRNNVIDTVYPVTNNVGNGIIVVHQSNNVTVENNVVKNCANHGIQVSYSSLACTIRNNTVANCKNQGLTVSRHSSATLTNNTVTASGQHGIILEDYANATILENTITGSNKCGVVLVNSKGTINNNTITNNKSYGIDLCKLSSGIIKENMLSDNNIIELVLYDKSEATIMNNKIVTKRPNMISQYAMLIQDGCKVVGDVKTTYLTRQSSSSTNLRGTAPAGMTVTARIHGKMISTTANSGNIYDINFPAYNAGATTEISLKDANGNYVCIGQSQINRKKVEAFVTRLYKLCMGRKPDKAGLSYWTDKLISGEMSSAEVVYQFLNGAEYTKKKTSNTTYLKDLYQVLMNRKADDSGLKYWKSVMNKGVSRNYILNQYIKSKEFNDICKSYGLDTGYITLKESRDQNINVTAYVQRIYQKTMERNGDAAGLNYWTNQILTKKATPTAAAEAFIFTPEFQKKKLTNDQYIKVLYQTFMGRNADAAGLKYWKSELKTKSRKQVLRSFASCAEFQKIMKSFGL